jgi:hypothetical protein
VAKQESRNISELFREAFRTYRLDRMQRKLSATRAAVAVRTGLRYTEDDVEQLVEMRLPRCGRSVRYRCSSKNSRSWIQ